MAHTLRFRVLGLTLLAGLAAGLVHAATSTAQMTVSASVVPTAAVSVPPISVAADLGNGGTGNAAINLTLSPGLQATLKLGQGRNAGNGSSDAAPVRRMESNGNYLAYDLYKDAALTIPWGNTSGTGQSVTGDGTPKEVKAYVKVLPGQGVPAGTYTDTVTLTVDY